MGKGRGSGGPCEAEGEGAAGGGEEDRGGGGIAGEVEDAGGAGDRGAIEEVADLGEGGPVAVETGTGPNVEERAAAISEPAGVIDGCGAGGPVDA